MESELWSYLKTSTKPIVLYGMGNGADKIIAVLEEKGIEFKGIFASDGFVRNKTFHGLPIASYSELKEKFGQMIVLLCFGSAREEVIENVKRISKENELFAPEVPVIGGGLFDIDYYNKNKAAFAEIEKIFADEKSKQTYRNILNYKLSGKPEYLFECESDINEPFYKILQLNNNEVYLDLGAYNGDTALEFIEKTSGFKKIIAAEPDRKNFAKLKKNTDSIENVELLNVGISDFCGKGAFSLSGGRNSAAGGSGEVEFLTIDEICKNEAVTYIKMDIEGNELSAIKGAKKTISTQKPKLRIAAYHRTEDFLSLIPAVLELNPDYKVFVRHFPSLPAWDTDFYFVDIKTKSLPK